VIWVISDTHLIKSNSLPKDFIQRVEQRDIIIHLGDIISLEVLEYLRGLCLLEAVRGNCDLPNIRGNLSFKKVIELEGRRIGLMHGQGGQAQTMEMVKHEFGGRVEIALFGHTHLPYQSRENGILYFNPGSLGDGRNGINSYGILHLEPEPWGETIEV
jgi:putative phosphoesterase